MIVQCDIQKYFLLNVLIIGLYFQEKHLLKLILQIITLRRKKKKEIIGLF